MAEQSARAGAARALRPDREGPARPHDSAVRGSLREGVQTFALMGGGINAFAMVVHLLGAVTGASEAGFSTMGQESLEAVVQILPAIGAYQAASRDEATEGELHRWAALLAFGLSAVSTGYDSVFMYQVNAPVHPSWICLILISYALLVPTAHPLRRAALVWMQASLWPAALAVWALGGYAPQITAWRALWDATLALIPVWICGVVAFGLVRRARRQRAALAEARHEAVELREDLEELGSYRLVRKLGEGGMGEVWLAEHALLKRPAAVKIVRADVLKADGARTSADVQVALTRFEREAQVMSQLTSPHTVQVYDFGSTEGGEYFYAMELLRGMDLETLLYRFGPQPQARVREWLVQACDSLAEAHEAGLIHRDIKPANLFLCRQGTRHDVIKLLDFGLVTLRAASGEHTTPAPMLASSDQTHLTIQGAVAGTPAFIAPEQIQHSPRLDGRADLYALGCVGYVLLCGEDVFQDANVRELLLSHLHSPPPPLSSRPLREPVHPELEAILMRCLEKDPARRPQTARELGEALQACPLDAAWSAHDSQRWAQEHLIHMPDPTLTEHPTLDHGSAQTPSPSLEHLGPNTLDGPTHRITRNLLRALRRAHADERAAAAPQPSSSSDA